MAECFDLMGFLDGTCVALSSTLTSDLGVASPNPAFLLWRMKDKKLLSVMYTSLTVEADSEIIDCTTSHAAWTALTVAYSDTSASLTHQLREELLSLHKGDLFVKEYGRMFKGLCDQLSAIGRPIDGADKSHWFLRGLGVQFASFTDTRMALAIISGFRDMLHQARQFELMIRAIEGNWSSNAAFTALSGVTSSGPPILLETRIREIRALPLRGIIRVAAPFKIEAREISLASGKIQAIIHKGRILLGVIVRTFLAVRFIVGSTMLISVLN